MTHGAILLVEDNDDDAELTVLAFQRAHLLNPVVIAEDGAIALDHLFGSGRFAAHDAALPLLMILDLNLPKVSGLDVLRRVRAEERTRLMPVVILSTSDEDEDVINSYALGANAYVRKPVAFEDFLTAAARLGMFGLLTNTQAPPGAPPPA